MSLNSELDELRARVSHSLPPGVYDRLQAEAATIHASSKLKRARRAGDVAPEFKLSDVRGETVRLSDLLKTGPVVLSFNRGDWCQFCELELKALEGIRRDVSALGATLVAIATQSAGTRKPHSAEGFGFRLLVDPDAKLASSFGVTFTPSADLGDAYAALGRPSAENSKTALPIPATYIIDQTGMVVFSYLDSDFTRRLDPSEILIVLRKLAERRPQANASVDPVAPTFL